MPSAVDESFEVTQDGSVLHVRFATPARRNALTIEAWLGIPSLVQRVSSMQGVRLVVLGSTTAGMFSSGANLTDFDVTSRDVEWTIAHQRAVSAAVEVLRTCAHPTLAAIDGAAMGAGAALAVACDFRIATPSSIIGFPPAKLGLTYPQSAVSQLIALVGVSGARRMLLKARTFSATEALEVGLVDSVVDSLSEGIADVAAQFTHTSAVAVRNLKRSIIRAQDDPGAHGDDLVESCVESGDFYEGVHAFLERRSPDFRR